MTVTSRELVYQTLEFQQPHRAPRHLWFLPWAETHYPEDLQKIQKDFLVDFASVNPDFRQQPSVKGKAYEIGCYVDEWGCVFENLQEGIIGEVREALIQDWDQDTGKVHIPREWLTVNVDSVNRQCAETDQFVIAGACPRPFEQLQFLRKTENLYMDLAELPEGMKEFMKVMHAFYCEVMQLWASTDVDALMFMDDWGSQRSLLINPRSWRKLFMPMYRDYIEIAHGAGKKIFMHSDGYIVQILPDLIDLGLDAINSQIFCMGAETLAPFAGKITFWGEIDRQHLLPHGTTADVDAAVRLVHQHLWKDGGCIAQCEFGPGAKPENVYQVFDSWDALTRRDLR